MRSAIFWLVSISLAGSIPGAGFHITDDFTAGSNAWTPGPGWSVVSTGEGFMFTDAIMRVIA
jgi:hypothetical protein